MNVFRIDFSKPSTTTAVLPRVCLHRPATGQVVTRQKNARQKLFEEVSGDSASRMSTEAGRAAVCGIDILDDSFDVNRAAVSVGVTAAEANPLAGGEPDLNSNFF